MAIRLSHQTVFGQFEQLRATIEQSALEMKAQFATGTDDHRAATQLVVLWNRCVDWRGKMAQLRALAGANPTLLQYMKDQLADQGYDGVAMVNAIEDACAAIQAAISAGMPTDESGYWALGRPQNGNSQFRWRAFTPQVLAPLHQDPPATPHLLSDLIDAVR